MRLLWEERAWEDYCYWQMQDKKTLRKINKLIKDIQRDTFSGEGKPEPLKENLSGWWSRRIDEETDLFIRRKTATLSLQPVKDIMIIKFKDID